jgi:ABC-type branched-subunit amino acid transport system permease subunit
MAVKVSVSPLGAAVGAFLGAIARPLVVYAYIHDQLGPNDGLTSILGISAIIGLSVGGLGGLFGKPLISAVVGGALGVAAYYVTFIPLAFCLCLTGLEQRQGGGDPPPWWAMMLTGAVPAVIGAAAEMLAGRKTPPSAAADVPATPRPPEQPGDSQGA